MPVGYNTCYFGAVRYELDCLGMDFVALVYRPATCCENPKLRTSPLQVYKPQTMPGPVPSAHVLANLVAPEIAVSSAPGRLSVQGTTRDSALPSEKLAKSYWFNKGATFIAPRPLASSYLAWLHRVISHVLLTCSVSTLLIRCEGYARYAHQAEAHRKKVTAQPTPGRSS